MFGLGRKARNYRYDPGKDHYDPAAPDPALERLGVAYFQTAYELFESRHYLPSEPHGQIADASAPGR